MAVWAAASAAGGWLLTLPEEQFALGGDFVAFWGAAKSLSRGENPYDPVNLNRYLSDRGEKTEAALREYAKRIGAKTEQELGRDDHIPYYYPPWTVYGAMALMPLGYDPARNVWLTWGFLAYLAATTILAMRPGPFSLPMRLCIFGGLTTWIVPLRLGQVVAPTLLLLVLCLLAWEQRRDGLLGLLLVLAVIKPQVSALPVLLVLLAAARDRRWVVWGSAGGSAVVLALSACWFRPGWLFEYLAAPRLNPPPTEIDGLGAGPQLGCSLWSGLMLLFGKSGGGASFAATGSGYLAAVAIQLVVAAAILIPLFWMAWKGARGGEKTSVERLLAAGVLASWFLSPYLRYYDLPMLCLTVAHLLNRNLSIPVKAGFAFVWVTGPLVDFFLDASKTVVLMHFHWWWVAVFVGVFWLVDAFSKPAADATLPADSEPQASPAPAAAG